MKKYWENIEVGDQIAPYAGQPISRVHIAQFQAAANDFSPLHLDEEFAKNVGFGTVFASNLFSLGFIEQALHGFAQNMSVVSLTATFQRIIWPQDIIVAKAMVIRHYEKNGEHRIQWNVWCENQHQEVVAKGTAVCTLWKNPSHEKGQKSIKPGVSAKSEKAFLERCNLLLKKTKKKELTKVEEAL